MSRNLYSLKDVFVPVGVPSLTFVKRFNLERSIKSWKLSEAKHLLIFGSSKSGKTSLWKSFIPEYQVIKISCNSTKTLDFIYSEILYILDSFYKSEITKGEGSKLGILTELQSILGIVTAKLQAQGEINTSEVEKQVRVSPPSISADTVIKFLKESKKIIVIEDFHYANDELKSKLSEDLKAFSDEKCPWILVGVQHKTSELLSYNLDLQQRIAEIPVEGFSNEELETLITLGEIPLNIEFSSRIKKRIVAESLNSAAIVQNICQRVCLLLGINETHPRDKYEITNENFVELACKEIAYENKSYYERAIKNISLGGRASGSTEKYKWFIKLIREKEIPEQGLRNTEMLRYLRELGHPSIQQGSVTSGLNYLPKLLYKSNYPAFFDFDEATKTFFLLDKYMKFVLKWIPNLVDELFPEDS